MAASRAHLMLVEPAVAPTIEVGVGDAELVGRVLAGDRSAAEILYRRHAADALRLAACLLRRRAEAEDAMQDAFVAALGKLATLREPAAFGGWLGRIVTNQARQRMRRRWWRGWLGSDGDDDVTLDSLAAAGASPEQRAELAQIDRALAKLSTSERTAWTLRFVEGWELKEIAESLDVSLATAKRRVLAARTQLAELLGHELSIHEEEAP